MKFDEGAVYALVTENAIAKVVKLKGFFHENKFVAIILTFIHEQNIT